MKPKTLLTTALLTFTLQAAAQISTDGTLGPSVNLSGPNFQIGAELGQQHGPNLFHSFRDFNLNRHESANFSGPNSIQNILSRVTGGNPSHIDGLFRSTISGANVYFLNPSGIMFGPNTRLDVQGSFHASTADYLRLEQNGRFDVRNPSNSILTVAPIESFGFLTHSPSALSMEDSQLTLLPTTTFSMVGGDLILKNTQLAIPSGHINLASIAKAGEVEVSTFTTDVEKQGTINIFDHSTLDVSGLGAGGISIHGGQLLLHDSLLQANALGNLDGYGIHLRLNESVDIFRPMIVNNEVFSIVNRNFGSGTVGGINITTPELSITKGGINTSNFGAGHAGNIDIETARMALKEGGSLSTVGLGSGQSGQININATESFSISGRHTDTFVIDGFTLVDFPSVVSSDTYATGASGDIHITTSVLEVEGGIIAAENHGLNFSSANIMINADVVNMSGGGFISNSAHARTNQEGGRLSLNVTEILSVVGKRAGIYTDPSGLFVQNNVTGIGIGAYGEANAGFLSINADTLVIENGGMISASTAGQGHAGQMEISVKKIRISGDSLLTVSSGGWLNNNFFAGGGQGGNLKIQADTITLTNGGGITANSFGTGNAGNLFISANQLNLTNNGKIRTSAKNARGGNITLNIPNLLYLQQGEITTSVHGGIGDGGNINIANPRFTVLNQGQITAQADAGQGGNIHIVADQFIKSPDSLISASSRLGLDGDIDIESPAVDMDSFLVVLPGSDDEVQLQLPKGCTAEDILNPRTTFHVRTVPEGRLKSPESFIE